jgi:hypothetical protein
MNAKTTLKPGTTKRYSKPRNFLFSTLLSLFAMCTAVSTGAQTLESYPEVRSALPGFAIKTNLLYGLGTLTPNIAAELALAPRWTVGFAYSSNPWESNSVDKKKFTHGIARLETRYWLCERFSGHFLGIHGLYCEYNINGIALPPVLDNRYRYDGNAWGAGVDYGYNLPVGGRWNLEFTVGAGIYRIEYDRFTCEKCDRNATPKAKTYLGPSHLGVTAVFLFK